MSTSTSPIGIAIKRIVDDIINEELAVDPDTPDMYEPLTKVLSDAIALYVTTLMTNQSKIVVPKTKAKKSKSSESRKNPYAPFVGLVAKLHRNQLSHELCDTQLVAGFNYVDATSTSAEKYKALDLGIDGTTMSLRELYDIVVARDPSMKGIPRTGVIWGIIPKDTREALVARYLESLPPKA
jgi:hypothetical protein